MQYDSSTDEEAGAFPAEFHGDSPASRPRLSSEDIYELSLDCAQRPPCVDDQDLDTGSSGGQALLPSASFSPDLGAHLSPRDQKRHHADVSTMHHEASAPSATNLEDDAQQYRESQQLDGEQLREMGEGPPRKRRRRFIAQPFPGFDDFVAQTPLVAATAVPQSVSHSAAAAPLSEWRGDDQPTTMAAQTCSNAPVTPRSEALQDHQHQHTPIVGVDLASMSQSRNAAGMPERSPSPLWRGSLSGLEAGVSLPTSAARSPSPPSSSAARQTQRPPSLQTEEPESQIESARSAFAHQNDKASQTANFDAPAPRRVAEAAQDMLAEAESTSVSQSDRDGVIQCEHEDRKNDSNVPPQSQQEHEHFAADASSPPFFQTPPAAALNTMNETSEPPGLTIAEIITMSKLQDHESIETQEASNRQGPYPSPTGKQDAPQPALSHVPSTPDGGAQGTSLILSQQSRPGLWPSTPNSFEGSSTVQSALSYYARASRPSYFPPIPKYQPSAQFLARLEASKVREEKRRARHEADLVRLGEARHELEERERQQERCRQEKLDWEETRKRNNARHLKRVKDAAANVAAMEDEVSKLEQKIADFESAE